MDISEKLYGALNNLLTHMEMQEQTEGFSLELNMFPFNPKTAMDEAREAIEAAQQAGVVGLAAGFVKIKVRRKRRATNPQTVGLFLARKGET